MTGTDVFRDYTGFCSLVQNNIFVFLANEEDKQKSKLRDLFQDKGGENFHSTNFNSSLVC